MNLVGSETTTVFELDVEQILASSLHAGQMVVVDNPRCTKVHGSSRRETSLFACLTRHSRSLLKAQNRPVTSWSQNTRSAARSH